jgi:hypothetical protein
MLYPGIVKRKTNSADSAGSKTMKTSTISTRSTSSIRRYLAVTAAVAGTTLALGATTARADQLPTSDPAQGGGPVAEAPAQPEQPSQAPAQTEQEAYNEQTMGARNLTQAQAEQALNPYGYWVVIPGTGRVWVPNQSVVGANFRPYSEGRWAYTSYGWTWVDNQAWGWVPSHYGRWVYAPTYGWAWAPGYRWAPAWVSWRIGGGYVGWAPYGYLASWGYRPWTFVGTRYFLYPRVGFYGVGYGYIGGIWGRTAFVRGYSVYGGYGFFRGPAFGVVRGWGSFGYRAAGYRAGFRAGLGAGYRGGYRAGAGFRGGYNGGFRGGYGGARVGGGFRAGANAGYRAGASAGFRAGARTGGAVHTGRTYGTSRAVGGGSVRGGGGRRR